MKVKFGAVGEPLLAAITPIEDVALLQALADAIADAESPEAVQVWRTDESAKRTARTTAANGVSDMPPGEE